MTRLDREKRVTIEIYSKQYFISHPYMVYDSMTGWHKFCHDLDEARFCRETYISDIAC